MFKYYNYDTNIILLSLLKKYSYILDIFYYMQVLCLVEKMHLSNLNDEGTGFCNTYIMFIKSKGFLARL
jgi:hypothetical protein